MNASDAEAEVGALYDNALEAIRSKDLERLMALYSTDVVYFDVVPPLRFAGSGALRDRFTQWFAGFEGPVTVDSRDMSISVSGDLAFVHWFNRVGGTLRNGRTVGSWVRVTSCCRRMAGEWTITHEHVSLPVDMASGSAVIDLVPQE